MSNQIKTIGRYITSALGSGVQLIPTFNSESFPKEFEKYKKFVFEHKNNDILTINTAKTAEANLDYHQPNYDDVYVSLAKKVNSETISPEIANLILGQLSNANQSPEVNERNIKVLFTTGQAVNYGILNNDILNAHNAEDFLNIAQQLQTQIAIGNNYAGIISCAKTFAEGIQSNPNLTDNNKAQLINEFYRTSWDCASNIYDYYRNYQAKDGNIFGIIPSSDINFWQNFHKKIKAFDNEEMAKKSIRYQFDFYKDQMTKILPSPTNMNNITKLNKSITRNQDSIPQYVRILYTGISSNQHSNSIEMSKR